MASQKSQVSLPILLMAFAAAGEAKGVQRIGIESVLPPDHGMKNTMVVGRSPGDGSAARVNPPVFRWSYVPDVSKLTRDTQVLYRFRFQIAEDPEFGNPRIDLVTESSCVNELAVLPEGRRYFWRVGYLCQMASWDGQTLDAPAEKEPGAWSPAWSFSVGPATPVWDRSLLQKPDFGEHPRLTVRKGRLEALRALIKTDPLRASSFEKDILKVAHEMTEYKYWKEPWPDSDTGEEIKGYYHIGRQLAAAAFAYRITGDPRFRRVKDIFLKIASYPRGGRSSPQEMGGDDDEDSTSLTEFLALAYDWFYDEYTTEERKVFEKSLEWRIEAWMQEFPWGGAWFNRFKHNSYDGPAVNLQCLPLLGDDHAWEGAMATFPASIAIYEKSAIARRYFHLMANYLIAVGERNGQNGCPDSGLSYGHSKLKWFLYQSLYLHSALPDLKLNRNPLYADLANYLIAVAPAGLPHAPWGRYDSLGSFWMHRKEVLPLLAYFSGNGILCQSWLNGGKTRGFWWRPWQTIAAPLHFAKEPEPETGTETDFIFTSSGWAASHAYPPTDPKAFTEGAGLILACRPSLGKKDTVFYNNAAVQFYAYGEALNFGGGPGGEDPQPFHSMCHNTVLIDGIGQVDGGLARFTIPVRGAILCHKKEKDCVYFMQDATHWYPKAPYRLYGWEKVKIDPEGKVYGKVAVPYLKQFRRHVLFMRRKYFVIFDQLETSADHPSRFSWLYHVQGPGESRFDPKTCRIEYAAGKVPVILQHMAYPGELNFEDRQGLDGLKNPLTGEDLTRNKYTKQTLEDPKLKGRFPEHNYWFTNKTPASRFHYLAVIYPVKPGAAVPAIERMDDFTFSVENGGERDVISFDSATRHPATHWVDIEAIGKAAKLLE